jgi:hypothetical protein
MMGRSFNQKELHDRGEAWALAPMFAITDKRISVWARCILVYGLGKPDDWTHSVESIGRALGGHRDTVRKALTELENHGYAVRHVWRQGGRQRSDTTFHYPPLFIEGEDRPDQSSDAKIQRPETAQGEQQRPETYQGGQSMGAESWAQNHGRRIMGAIEPTIPKEGGTREEGPKEEMTREEGKPSSATPPMSETTTVVDDQISTDSTTPTPGHHSPLTDDAPVAAPAISGRFAVVDDDDDEPPAKPARKAPRTRTSKTSGDEQFDKFWEAYGKKVGRGLALDAWEKAITREDPAVILAAVAPYVASKPEKKFRLDPERWLKRDSWTDEIIENTPTNGHTNGHVAYRDPQERKIITRADLDRFRRSHD